MNFSNLKISVCMATYNGERFVSSQLDSILNQLRPNDEIVIYDDASIDDTVGIIKSINDPRIFLIENKINVGVSAAFNAALSYSSGEIIFISDQDDLWLENKVSIILDYLLTSDFDLIVHDAYIDINGTIQSKSLFSHRSSRPGILKNIFRNTYTGCCIALKRSLLIKLLPIPHGIGAFHDAWIGVLSEAYSAKPFFLPTPLIYFRRHSSNVSSLTRRRSLFSAFFDRVVFVSYLINRLFINKVNVREYEKPR